MAGQIELIREKIRGGYYELTRHAEEEKEADNFEAVDIETAILNGKIVKRFTHDPRGVRYLIRGNTIDGKEVHIVCRFLKSGKLRIITVYAPEGRQEI